MKNFEPNAELLAICFYFLFFNVTLSVVIDDHILTVMILVMKCYVTGLSRLFLI